MAAVETSHFGRSSPLINAKHLSDDDIIDMRTYLLQKLSVSNPTNSVAQSFTDTRCPFIYIFIMILTILTFITKKHVIGHEMINYHYYFLN